MGNKHGGYDARCGGVGPCGGATVFTGSSNRPGYSHLAAQSAPNVGLPMERVRVVLGDTELCPYAATAPRSRGSCGRGGRAGIPAVRTSHTPAAHLLEASAEDSRWWMGSACARLARPPLSVAAVAQCSRGQNLPAIYLVSSRVPYTVELTYPYDVHVVAC